MQNSHKRNDTMSLTSSYPGIVDTVHSKIQIKYNGKLLDQKFIGIWDTGANKTVINLELVQQFGLIKIDERPVLTANGQRQAGVYLVDLILHNGVAFSNLEIIDGIMTVDFLIGMDIITQGDFIITNKDRTVMSFRKPSMKTVDYVQ